ncbi:CGNR zinc finger domain-containing protein [Streptomyces sp. NPDC049040]|uniref:CGNR zinc finger domain-containing protein n=1 Tax=Streptomyces sp. NPDC049040 TaxID=3365593 RepID=UPI003719DDC9
MFDSHVTVVLDAAVSLVNALTDGEARGKPYTAPRGAALPAAVDAALPAVPVRAGSAGRADGHDGGRDTGERARRRVDQESADRLAATAREIRRVFVSVDAGRHDEAADAINALLLTTGARPQLDRSPGEPWQLHFHGADDSLAVGWGAGCATGLAVAVGSELAGRLGVCRAAQCDRVYVDTSRNAGRRFCSTACQNRTKAAAFRARRDTAG